MALVEIVPVLCSVPDVVGVVGDDGGEMMRWKAWERRARAVEVVWMKENGRRVLQSQPSHFASRLGQYAFALFTGPTHFGYRAGVVVDLQWFFYGFRWA